MAYYAPLKSSHEKFVPESIDIDEVIVKRPSLWVMVPVWPDITVAALIDEVVRLRKAENDMLRVLGKLKMKEVEE